MNSLRLKLVVQFFVANGATVANFLLSVYIARLLKPSEIGIFSMAAVLVAFAHVFRDFGVVSFIRSQKTLTTDSLRAAMGVMVCASWSFALVVFLAAPFAADYYKHPGVAEVMRVLAIGFLFIPLGSIPQAVLARELDVRVHGIVSVVSVCAYAASCIILAKLGFSYMSFAWANLINILVTASTFSLLRPKHLPLLPSLRGWREVVQFGGGTMLTNSIRSADNALPDLVIGRLSSASFVGLFSRANSTVNMLNTIAGPTINFATLPYLAKVHHSGENVSREVGRIIAYLTGVMWPVLGVLALVPQDVILLLYGPSWLECAVLIPALCVMTGVQLCFSILQPAFTAMGRPYLAASPLFIGILGKVAFSVLLFDGTLKGFATAFLLGELLSIPVYLVLARKTMGLYPADWLSATWRSAVTTLIVLGALYLVSPLLSSVSHPAGRLALVAIFASLVWPTALMVLRHPLTDELMRAKNVLSSRLSRA
jgi:O-antigen/teichoic acid export membrane protein